MTTYRSDISLNSNVSTNRLICENENLTKKYNEYKKNLNQMTSNNLLKSYNKEFDNYNLNVIKLSSSENLLLCSNFPDNDNDIKYTHLKALYDERIMSLHNQLRQIPNLIRTDEILNTMRKDLNTQEFLIQRIGEIINENLGKEKEEIIEKLIEENAELKSKIHVLNLNSNQSSLNCNFQNSEKIRNLEKLLQEEKQKNLSLQNNLINSQSQNNLEKFSNNSSQIFSLKKDNNMLQQQISFYEERLKEISEENEENKLDLDRLQKIISVLEIDLNSSEATIKEKQGRIETLQAEQSNLQTQFFELNLKYKKFAEELKAYQTQNQIYEKEKKEILEKYSTYTEELERSRSEKLEKQNQEKLDQLNKNLQEMKINNENLENEISQEKSNFNKMKNYYTKLLSEMEEGMKLIKLKWKKKLEEENSQFEKVISELENKHSLEIENIKHEHQIEIESNLREVNKLKQTEDLLRNFEKEFLKISQHEEIMKETISEMKKKFEKDLRMKEEEKEAELKRRISKLEDDKNGEYEFLTENLRKHLKSLEKANEELKENLMDLQNKLYQEISANENLSEIYGNLQKRLRDLDMEIEEKNSLNANLISKINQYEENIKSLEQTVKGVYLELDELRNENFSLENEKNSLYKKIRDNEENFKDEISKIERANKLNIERLEEILNQQKDLNIKLKKDNCDLLKSLQDLQDENSNISRKLKEISKIKEEQESNISQLNTKIKFTEENLKETEKKLLECKRIINKQQIDNSHKTQIIVKTTKSKISILRTEIESIKSTYKSELTNIKKESSRAIDLISFEIKSLIVKKEKEFELKMKNFKAHSENESIKKYQEKEAEHTTELKKLEQKYEKHLLEQFKINGALEKQNKILLEQTQMNLLKSKEHILKIQENEHEINSLQNQITKLKLEKEVLTDTLEKIRTGNPSCNRLNSNSDHPEEYLKQESIKRQTKALSSFTFSLNKMKKKYTEKFFDLKKEIEKLKESNECKKLFFYFVISRKIQTLHEILFDHKILRKST